MANGMHNMDEGPQKQQMQAPRPRGRCPWSKWLIWAGSNFGEDAGCHVWVTEKVMKAHFSWEPNFP